MSYSTGVMMPLFINSNFSFIFRTRVDREVKFLIEDARKAIAKAKEENNYGNIAHELAVKGGRKNTIKRRNLSKISHWHFERGIEKYYEAIKYLKIAAIHDLPERYKKYIALQIKESEKQLNIVLKQKDN